MAICDAPAQIAKRRYLFFPKLTDLYVHPLSENHVETIYYKIVTSVNKYNTIYGICQHWDYFGRLLGTPEIASFLRLHKKRTITKMILFLINYFVLLTNCSDI